MTLCETCGRDPCFPWADAHDNDFAREITREELKEKCKTLLIEARGIMDEQAALLTDARSLIAGFKEKLRKIKEIAVGEKQFTYDNLDPQLRTLLLDHIQHLYQILVNIEEECDR